MICCIQWTGYLGTIAGERYQGGDSGIEPIVYAQSDTPHLKGFQKNSLISGHLSMLWKADEESGMMHLILVGKTLGWVGFGLSEHGAIPGSDLVVAWVDSTGKAHATDRWAKDHKTQLVDDCQDWKAVSGIEKRGHTTIHLQRKLDTKDVNQDRPFVRSQNDFVVYAIGKTDNFRHWGHRQDSSRFGYQNMKLFGPDDPNIWKGTRKLPSDSVPMVISKPYKMKKTKTNILCTAYNLEKMKGKYMVGIDPVIR